MNHLITETVTQSFDVLHPNDRFTLISRYLKDGAVIDTDHFTEVNEATGLRKPAGVNILKNGEIVAILRGEGYNHPNIQAAETFKAEYEKAVAEGLESIRPQPQGPAKGTKKKSNAVTANSGGVRGKLSQAQKEEILAMEAEGMTAQQISEQVGRSVETVTKYMKGNGNIPVGTMAEEDDDEDFQGADDALEADEEEEEAVVIG